MSAVCADHRRDASVTATADGWTLPGVPTSLRKPNYPTPWRFEFGIMWVRTECTEHEMEMRHADLFEMAALADDVNAAVLDATGMQVCMQPNGWAATPAGADPRKVEDAIDRALTTVLEGAAA